MNTVHFLHLPYPPTVNTYWRHVGHKVLISAQGREYRKKVCDEVTAYFLRINEKPKTLKARLWVVILLRPPDRRKRDIDNTLKGLLDALKHAGLYEDDEQIDRLSVERGSVLQGGRAEVEVGVISTEET